MKEYKVKEYDNGDEAWWFNGKLHRENGPAFIRLNGYKVWWQNGKRHREDGPAIITNRGTKMWFKNDKLHCENGPAIEYKDGKKEWFKNGQRHREDGPAIIWPNGHKEWWSDGKLHRTDGAAVIWSDGSKEYYINGIQYTEQEFNYDMFDEKTNNVTEKDFTWIVSFFTPITKEMVHFVEYEYMPSVIEINSLFDELKTDSQFKFSSAFVDSLCVSILKNNIKCIDLIQGKDE